MDVLDQMEESIRSVVGGRKWIVPTAAAAAATDDVARMRALGAADVVVVAAVTGVGDQPDCRVVLTGAVPGTSIMDGFRTFERSVGSPSPELLVKLDGFDPGRTALIMGGPFDSGDHMLERRMYGARKPAWAALEDKIAISAVFEEAGIPTAPHVVVPVRAAPGAACAVESAHGSVWAADNRDGWHGGAEGTRWVGPSAAQRAAAAEWAAAIADEVRIMPFLDGVPCSIHGFRTDTGLAVFRPIEMNTFRTAGPGLRYGGLASTWKPHDALRTGMRNAASAVGRVLYDNYGYMGGFSLDGVATDAGFVPTEVNPRLSAGLMMQAAVVDRLDLGWVARGLVEGDVSLDHRWLEETVLAAAATQVGGRLVLALFEPVEPAEVRIRFDDGKAVPDEGSTAVATLSVGPGPAGPVVFMRFDSEHHPIGERFAPYALASARLAADLWEFDLEELTVAPGRYDGEIRRQAT